jgi:two-component system NtrC family sensor kinase
LKGEKDTAGPATGPGPSSERSRVLLHTLVLSAVDGVIAADMTGRIFLFNEAAARILGWSTEEALAGMNIRRFYADRGAEEVMRRLRADGDGGRGKLTSCRVSLVARNGEAVPVTLNASIVYDEDREVATVGFFHDLRDDLRMKEELARTQVQLLQAEKMSSLGKLAAGVAHQLNNPLNGIMLYTRLTMEEFPLQEQVKQNLFRVRADAERCRDTVRELLAFARQTGRSIRPHDINRSIERTLFLLQDQSIFHDIEIDRQLSPTLPAVPVDVQQMNHVFMNIILNAAEAMEGTGRLVVRSFLSSSGTHACVEIADTGPGIAAEVLPHIFEPFFTTKDVGKGTGLGLSVVYGIVNDHHGQVKVRSTPGSGAVFTVELPLGPGSEPGGGAGGDGFEQ